MEQPSPLATHAQASTGDSAGWTWKTSAAAATPAQQAKAPLDAHMLRSNNSP